jgi:hypothetical protein
MPSHTGVDSLTRFGDAVDAKEMVVLTMAMQLTKYQISQPSGPVQLLV